MLNILDFKDKIHLLKTLSDSDPVFVEITTFRSKYKGLVCKVQSAGRYRSTVRNKITNRSYIYYNEDLKITQNTLDTFNSTLLEKNGHTDYFNREVKSGDVIFYNATLFRIEFFRTKRTSWTKDLFRTHITTNSFSNYNGFVTSDILKKSILIDDPLLLLTI